MERIVDDRAFVIGLAELFREEMKAYEVDALLPLAETASHALGLSPSDAPLEGYYSESLELERFFRLIRSLQRVDMRMVPASVDEPSVQRLRSVTTSPAMGRVGDTNWVIPRTGSPFGEALHAVFNWSVEDLAACAQNLVRSDDAGLVAVASATGDPVALCIARESMALAADVEVAEIDSPDFTWAVSPRVTAVAARFISALADATGIVLPKAEAVSSSVYGEAAQAADLVGRCIMVGERPGALHPFYHWHITADGPRLAVHDFWSSAVWTTDTMRSLASMSRPIHGARVGPPPVQAERERGWVARLLGR